MEKEITIEKLTRFNMVMGALHLIQGLLMLFLASRVIQTIAEFTPTITQFYLTYDPVEESLVIASRDLFELPFGVFVALFLLISAVAHAVISLPRRTNAIYKRDLERGINKFRWFEYALSSSIMIVLIATLFGIYDIASLILIFIVNASMNLFGLVMEQLNEGREKKSVNWGPFIYGSIAGIAPWIAVFIYMFGIGDFSQVPWFVWAILVTYFIAFNTFPVNMVLQYLRKGKWNNYFYGERVYIILSLVAKSVLAWLVLFGAMQP